MKELKYPAFYFQGKAYFLEKSNKAEPIVFGGPHNALINYKGKKLNDVHHIMTIYWKVLELPKFRQLSFYYGMLYDGCYMEYKLDENNNLEVIKLDPETRSTDWPYEFYPMLLPYIKFKIDNIVDMNLDEFSDFTHQGLENVPNDSLILIIPIMNDIGVSLWGHDGDSAGVQIIFKVDVNTMSYSVTNECD